jgi:hypothetical protein
MENKRPILLGGLALIATGILYPAIFTYLAVRFDYPDVLDGPAHDVLPNLLAGGWAFRAAWAAYGLLPLLLIPAGVGAFYALRKHMEGGMRLALHLSVLSAMALMLGLLRWSGIHWELARFHKTADAPQREVIGAIFNALNSYLGNYIGEFLGEGLMHGFLFLTAMAMLKSAAFPKWMGWTGIVVSGLSLVGVFRNVNGIAESIQDLANMLMLFPIWLVILGIGLARSTNPSELPNRMD